MKTQMGKGEESMLPQYHENTNGQSRFDQLIKENGLSIYKYIYSLIRHKEQAEDLYQEVLISAFLAFPAFKEEAKFRSWLYRIAINKCRDFWRKEKKEKRFWEEEAYKYSMEAEKSPEPEEEFLHKSHREEMVETISSLPDMYRDPLLLFYYHNRTLMEISDEVGAPMSTVKTRMKRGKERLKVRLGGE
ncbi:RNA polymerase sigma factor [Bacillus infantis]|uniref:RNA polymerase sigma factor n=2 Tax=Bacillus infantis TaxID=324767 RepID=A0A5D4RME6_9BACI|nr:RNA polymerase sigma factor [Bacillus infantis]